MTQRQRDLLPIAAAAVAFPLFAIFFFSLPSIPDLDSYYHLAVARLYAQHGLVAGLPWARFSTLGQTLGDKELLFHILLIPFSGSAVAGRIALALINAAAFGVVSWLALRAGGRWALAVPFWMFASAGAFFFRTTRLRPETLALILLLLLVWFLAELRPLAAGLIALLFTLSYTAAHVAVGIAAIAVAVIAVREKTLHWKLVAWPLTGTIAGLVLRPHFPDNLKIFWTQNALFFARKSVLDVGEEITAPLASDILLFNLGWIIGLWLLWRSTAETSNRAAEGERRAAVFTAAAAVFTVLFLFMERMAIYAVPFVTLAVLFCAARRGELTPRVRLIAGRTAPLLPLLAVCVALSAPYTQRLIRTMSSETTGIATDENDWRQFAEQLPPGAKVAAPWGSAEAFCYWAPQAGYLNVLDPIFMAEPFPMQYRAQRALFAGDEPDVAFVATDVLDSDFIAFRAGEVSEKLVERLKRDPRIRLRYAGKRNFLVELVDDANSRFIRDWRVADPRNPDRIGRYSRPASPRGRRREGFVELTSVAGEATCVSASRTFEAAGSGETMLEFAPYAAGEFFVDGRLVAREQSGSGAVVGHGIMIPLTLSAGRHTMEVRSCRGPASRRNGFYLVDRTP